MINSDSSKLSAEQWLQYEEKGYYYPIRVLEQSTAENLSERFLDYLAQNQERFSGLPPRVPRRHLRPFRNASLPR